MEQTCIRDSCSSKTRPGWFPFILSAALALNLLPVWGVDWPPLGDYGGHLELMDVMARHGSAETMYGDVYRLPAGLNTNVLSLYAARWLAPFVGTADVGRLLLSFYVVGLPLSLLLMARTFGRSRWLVLLSCPMVFNALFNVGFLNFLVAFPLLFLAMGLSRLAGKGQTWAAVGLATVLTLLFFTHVVAYLFALAISVLVLVVSSRRRKDWSGLLALVPAMPFFLLWAKRMIVDGQATEAGRAMVAADGGLGLAYVPLTTLLGQFHEWGMRFFRSSWDEVAFSLLAITWVILMMMGRHPVESRARVRSGPLDWARRHLLSIIVVCCILAYFAVPARMNEMSIINERIVLVVLFLATMLPRIRFPERQGRMMLIAMATVALAYPPVVWLHFHEYESQVVGRLPQAIAQLPDSSRLGYVMWQVRNPVTHMGPLWHLPKAIHAIENGGISDDSFALRPYTPIQYLPDRKPPDVATEFWNDPKLEFWDYILLRSQQRPEKAFRSATLEIRFQEGVWWLFEVVKEDAHPAVGTGRGVLPTS